MNIKHILYILILIIFYSCSSSRIEVKDNSELSSSRSVLFNKLDSIHKSRFSSISSYYLPKARFDINYSGSSYKLNGKLTLVTNSNINTNLTFPFPPISVGSLSLDKKHLEVSSSVVNLDLSKSVPSYYLQLINSLVYGTLPVNLLKFCRLSSVYISDNRYHLNYKAPHNTSINFQVDPLYRISQISIESSDFSGEMYTTDYKIVDNHSLPSKIRIILSSESINGSVSITTNTIKLNQ